MKIVRRRCRCLWIMSKHSFISSMSTCPRNRSSLYSVFSHYIIIIIIVNSSNSNTLSHFMTSQARVVCLLDAASCRRLRSTSRHQLIVPRHRRTEFGGRRAFSVGCRPDSLELAASSVAERRHFRRPIKTFICIVLEHVSALEAFA